MLELLQYLKTGDLSLPELSSNLNFITPEQASWKTYLPNHLQPHLVIHYPISERQWGFSHGKLTATALFFSFTWLFANPRQQGYGMLSVLWHCLSSSCSLASKVILNKPQPLHHKMDPKLPDLLNIICCHKSPALPVVYGVSQGSVLGPPASFPISILMMLLVLYPTERSLFIILSYLGSKTLTKLSAPQHIEVLLFTFLKEAYSNPPFISPACQQHSFVHC